MKEKQNIDSIDIRDLLKKMSATMAVAGLQLLSEDRCCKLLAITYVFGGGNEAFTYNLKLLRHIFYAQKYFNIEGGYTVEGKHILKIRKYIKELTEDIIRCEIELKAPDKSNEERKKVKLKSWAVDFMKEDYGVEIYKEGAIIENSVLLKYVKKGKIKVSPHGYIYVDKASWLK